MKHTIDRDNAVAKKKDDRRSRRVELVVTDEQYQTIESEAKSWGLDVSSYIRLAIEEKRRRDAANAPPADGD